LGNFRAFSNQNEETVFDYVITPLLYCDSFGNRVGYGKGFYDQFFQTINLMQKNRRELFRTD
jgi:5-formyltetrahydrofolate cyclo-ligase